MERTYNPTRLIILTFCALCKDVRDKKGKNGVSAKASEVFPNSGSAVQEWYDARIVGRRHSMGRDKMYPKRTWRCCTCVCGRE